MPGTFSLKAFSGYSGISGYSAASGYSGVGVSGFSGFSGLVAPTNGSAVLDFVSTDLTFQDPTKIELNAGKLELKYVGGGAAVVSPTDLTADDSRVIKSHERSGFEAWRMFDGSTSSGAFDDQITQQMPFWGGYYFDTAKDITQYRFFAGIAGGGGRAADAWMVEYSDNGADWTALHTVTGQWLTYAGVWYTSPTLASVGSHRYWRLNITAGANQQPWAILVYALEFWEVPTDYPAGTYYYARTTDVSQIDVIQAGAIRSCDITSTTPANTNIKMIVSFDGRSAWKKWGGSSWSTHLLANISTGNTPAEIETGLTNHQLGSTESTIDFAIALESDAGASTPNVDEIEVFYSVGIGLSGVSGFSGASGYSGYSGSSTSGYSGYSSYSGVSGFSGFGSGGADFLVVQIFS